MNLATLKAIDMYGEDKEVLIDTLMGNKEALKILLESLSYRGTDWQPREPDVGIARSSYGSLEIDKKESNPWALEVWDALPKSFREETEREILDHLANDAADDDDFDLPEFWD